MAKAKSVFVCQSCGKQHPRWSGQCDSCGEWQTLVEQVQESETSSFGLRREAVASPSIALSQLADGQTARRRLSTLIPELDRVLGGELANGVGQTEQVNAGLVPGAVVLVGGHPGVGKSTLLTQVVMAILSNQHQTGKLKKSSEKFAQKPILYVAGEESPEQISLRISRLLSSVQQKKARNTPSPVWSEQLQFATSTDVDQICSLIKEIEPQLVVVDSIQTLTTSDLTGSAGSVGQIRASAERLIEASKRHRTPMFLVGHVTKEGQIAGPKVLEHMVDVVLEMTGESTTDLRLVRSQKNRFGATDEVGVFQLGESGFISLANPSELFLADHPQPAPGSATTCLVEGTRPLLVEVQALVNKSFLPTPRRVGRGIDTARIQVLAAVLEKHSRLPLGNYDIFANLAGGFLSKETSIDLSLAVALASSLKNKPAPDHTIYIGEVGLLGEIRPVRFIDRRVKEAKRMGFKKIFHHKTHSSVSTLLSSLGLS